MKQKSPITLSYFLKMISVQRGATLIELIVSFIILSIALPSVILLVGQMGINHGKNEFVYKAASLANEKMEEIVAFKQLNNDWALWAANIAGFAGTETLTDGSQRTVTVTNINNWINEGGVTRNAFLVVVSVTPPFGPSHSVSIIFSVNY